METASTITMTQQYSTLVALAREGATTADALRSLNAFLRQLEDANGFKTYGLWVQWQETGKQVPTGFVFPETWPPEMRSLITLSSRPVAKSDVLEFLDKNAKSPTTVLVTADPGGTLGWTELDTFFAT